MTCSIRDTTSAVENQIFITSAGGMQNRRVIFRDIKSDGGEGTVFSVFADFSAPSRGMQNVGQVCARRNPPTVRSIVPLLMAVSNSRSTLVLSTVLKVLTNSSLDILSPVVY